MTDAALLDQVKALERKLSRLRILFLFQALLVLGFVVSQTPRVHGQSSSVVLRTQGIVIEDPKGGPRILIGAPFPQVRERLRQDTRSTAMIFLDEKGYDRLTVGEELNPQVGSNPLKVLHRISPAVGIVIHDGSGNERGAYSWLSNGRALISLDRPGVEAWAAVVDDKTGFAGMRIDYPRDVAEDSTGIEIGTQGSDAFVRLKDSSERERALLQFGPEAGTTLRTFDNRGNLVRDLVH
jgi:hypothetical protein